jgi:hypothetical protein
MLEYECGNTKKFKDAARQGFVMSMDQHFLGCSAAPQRVFFVVVAF